MFFRIVLFFLLSVFCTASFAETGETQTGTQITETITTITQTQGSSIFSQYEKIQTEKLKISEFEANSEYEKGENEKILQKIETQTNLLEQLDALVRDFQIAGTGALSISPEKEKLYTEFLQNFKQEFPDNTNIEESSLYFQAQYEKLSEILKNSLKELTLQKEESDKKLLIYEESLKNQQGELEKANIGFQKIIKDWGIKGMYFFGILGFVLLVSHIAKIFISRRTSLPDEKKQVLISLMHLARNIIMIISIILFFFSELLTFLPALAILGTAIGFAIRDVISSFIAWFVIGLKDTTFKLGDVIEIPRDSIFGEVVKIHPLVTTVKELGMSGPNGRFRTFPNKLIFETSLNNLWKYNGWTYIPLECMLTYESDIHEAKKIFLEVMNEVYFSDDFTHSTDSKVRLKKMGIQEKNQIPQVFVDVKTQGVFLRGKILVMWNERHEIRNRVVEQFAKRIKNSETVKLRYVDFWVNEMR